MCNESIEIKDEFMLAMKDFESDNVPPKNKKDENSDEMEVQEDFELQLESDSDDDMNDNEIEPPIMEIKDDGKHFFRLLKSGRGSLIIDNPSHFVFVL